MFTPSPGVKREAPFRLLVLLARQGLFVGNPGTALAQDDDCAKLADLELQADTATTDVELVTSGEFNPLEYATFSTDTGHAGSIIDGNWALDFSTGELKT